MNTILSLFYKKYAYIVIAIAGLISAVVCYWFQGSIWLCALQFVVGLFASIQSYAESRRTSNEIREISKRLDETGLKLIDSDNYIFAIVDQANNMLFGIHRDGSVDWSKGVPLPI